MTAKLDGTNGLIQQYDYQASTTGFSYTFAAGVNVLVMNPAGTLATGTITMPASPADGMTITFSSTKQITALTLSGNTGQTVVSGVTFLPANQATTYVYRLSNTSWYPTTTVATNVPATPAGGSIITSGTAVPYTSFTTTTYNDFTGIPSWVKRITILFQGLSVSATSPIQVQIGYQSPVTSSGYSGGVSIATSAVATLAYANGFYLNQQNAATWAHSGSMTITNISGNTWVANSVVGNATTLVGTNVGGGFITLSGVLDRVRITTISTTDTFDAGSINILYE